MLVFFKERLVLLSVPKTGSTAYHSALAPLADMAISGPPELKHAPLYRYNRFFRPMFEKICDAEMEIAAVMREPVSWLGSWYRYRSRPALRGHRNSTAGISFDEFVDAYCQDDRPPFAQVGDQAKFLEPRANGCKVDHLFAYEKPDILREFLRERLEAFPEIERRNVSPVAPLELSSKTRVRLERRHGDMFELYASIVQCS